jgi:selenocysteine lyase/cysteine desulfurase
MPTSSLPDQRALFDIPGDIGYFNAAGWSPLPRPVAEAGRRGVARKVQPWTLDAGLADELNERARRTAARLINADPADVALVSSVGYGCATAAKNVRVPTGTRVLVLEDDHTSPVLAWMARAEAEDFALETVPKPADGDWTAAILAAIGRPGAPPVAIASVSSVHWSDGCAVKLEPVASALKAHGAALLVDATHAVGVMDIDVRALDPDFVAFPTYKWLLGPYGRAFLYVAKRHQDGIPLEQTAFGRRDVAAEHDVYFADLRYRPDAGRFDMGERDHLIGMEMAAVGMELVAGWGAAAISERLAMLTGRIAEGIAELAGVTVPDEKFRAPHILSLGLAGTRAPDLVARLAADKIYVAPRLGRVRISPHVYNTEADVGRLVAAVRRRL